MTLIKRTPAALLAFLVAMTATLVASGAPADSAEQQCEGGHHGKAKHHGKGKHAFKKADKNRDGFLTKDEVGEQRWERIKVADANRDNKLSQPELQQARKDGKLARKRKS